ncbi:MAG: nuclear transport factor 2 family protein [Planctomycetota bacterium]
MQKAISASFTMPWKQSMQATMCTVLVAVSVSCSSVGTGDRQRLIDKIEQFNRAIREGDKDKYASVFVADFVFTWSRDGQVYDREMILPNVVPTPDYQPIVDEIRTRIYGDSAVANYRVRRNLDDSGTRVTFAYARIGDDWKVVASHSTAIVNEVDSGSE